MSSNRNLLIQPGGVYMVLELDEDGVIDPKTGRVCSEVRATAVNFEEAVDALTLMLKGVRDES